MIIKIKKIEPSIHEGKGKATEECESQFRAIHVSLAIYTRHKRMLLAIY